MSLPVNIAYKIAIFVSDLRYLFAFKDRAAIRDNLKVIFPEKSDKEICAIRLAMFRNFAKHLVDFFRFSEIDAGYVKKNIKIENIHHFDDALKSGKGVIALTAHLGSWELGGAILGILEYPIWVVALSHKHTQVNDFFNAQRGVKGVKVMQLGSASRGCLRLLKENKMIGLVGDRDFNESGIILDFFGKPMIFPEGPAVFPLKLGTRIVPGFVLRNKDDSFTFKVEEPIEFHPTGDKKKDMAALIGIYKGIFENYIRKYPDQWYMFRRFWKE